MVKTIIFEAISSGILPHGKHKVVMCNTQMEDLIASLQAALSYTGDDYCMPTLRERFHDEEGYMASDKNILEKYKDEIK